MILDDSISMRKPVIYDGKETVSLLADVEAKWNGFIIRAKAGYVFDGASIPRVAWRVIGHPFEEYFGPALFHDLLYDTEHFTRKEADECFLALMKSVEIGYIRRSLIYRAVRIGGGPTWIKHTPESIAAAKEFLEMTYA